MGPVVMGTGAESGISAGPVQRQASRVKSIKLPPMIAVLQVTSFLSSGGSVMSPDPGWSKQVSWELEDFLLAHRIIRASGKCNFEGCRIPVPTKIRHDRIREALGVEASSKELRVLDLLKFGMPINCNGAFGSRKVQKNHFSEVAHKE